MSRFVTDDGRAILLDRGFVPQELRHVERPPARLTVRGNLHWPDEKGSATPKPNLDENIWFARDVPAMAQALDTEPVMVVASFVEGDAQGVEPIPLAVEGIPNNHLSYAIQWFLIAATWAGMTVVGGAQRTLKMVLRALPTTATSSELTPNEVAARATCWMK